MSNKKANSKTTSNKKLFVVFSAIAIMVAVPLALHSPYHQKNVKSGNTESVLAAQTQSNSQGRVTVNLNTDIQAVSSANNDRKYGINVTYGNGNNCFQSDYQYKVNGLKFNRTGKAPTHNFCSKMFDSISSSANCNTFSLIAPSGYRNVGIGYKRADQGLSSFKFENVTSKTLCNYNYFILFAIEKN